MASAQPFTADEMASWGLEHYNRYSAAPVLSHVHIMDDCTTMPSPSAHWFFNAREPWRRAREINKDVFGDEDPRLAPRSALRTDTKAAAPPNTRFRSAGASRS